jgi:hypothetical protein
MQYFCSHPVAFPSRAFEPMGAATIALPTRWSEATLQIKQLIEKYGRRSGVTIDVILMGQLDREQQIYIVKDSLTSVERQVRQNAITEMNDYLNHTLSKDPWQASSDIMEQLQADLEAIGEIVEQALRGRER